jgi:hypothetical protein
MYLMYVDESGDPGKISSPTDFFILSAIVVHESFWLKYLNDAVSFRRYLKKTKQLLMKEEIHSAEFISQRSKLKNIKSRNNGLDILKQTIKWLSGRNYLSVITIYVDKSKYDDPFEAAWRGLMQRFENTLSHQNFPNSAFNKDLGVIVSDNTDGEKLTRLLRKMRKINFVPSMFSGSPARNLPIKFIIKDPVFRESAESYLIQFVDVVAYFARQYFKPNKYIRQKAAKNYYSNLAPILNPYVKQGATHHKIIMI